MTDLYTLLRDNKNNQDDILLIDIRPPEEYEGSRVNHRCSINVPQHLLQPGANINSIERKLSKSTWEVGVYIIAVIGTKVGRKWMIMRSE